MQIALSRTMLAATLILTAVEAGAQQRPQQPRQQHIATNASELEWTDGPASLPPGARIAVIEGDPAKAGPFTVRLRFPANYRIGPHSHPSAERVTVISGTLVVGTGENETRGKALTAGGFAVMPAGMVHHARARGETVIQLSGTGPFAIQYVKPADDPRRRPAQ